MSATPRKLKRVVIKEELVALTGDYISAVLLNQFLYWSKRIKGSDAFLREEQERTKCEDPHDAPEPPYMHGWIYKSAAELVDETMLGISEQTVRRKLERLAEVGYLSQRHNPLHKWDRTLQYRVNLNRLAQALQAIGYHLDEYDAFFTVENASSTMENHTVTNGGAIPDNTPEN